MYTEDEDNQDPEEEELTEHQHPNQDQMDYYMQQHPELLLALDIAAFRRQ
jgi:hypothetical protein